MKQIYANNQTTIQLGRQGENLARQVIFDLADWVEGYGDGVVELIVRRPGDEKPYPVAVTRKGSNAVWTLTATDMAVKTSFNNCGQCELRWYVGEILAKSYIWRTCVEPAMDTPAETAPPAPEQGWVDQVAATGAAAKVAAKAAKAEADRAADMADDVVRSIGEAGSCAVKQVQDATSEGVKTIRDAGSEERSSLENAGDAQIERIKDEGETQTTNAKSQADAAALSAADAAQSAQEAAESAAVYGEVVSDVTQLKADIADNAKSDAVTKRSLDAIWKLNQGISYQFETDDSDAYSKTVPSGAKLASVGSIGGHTEVIDGELVSADVESVVERGKNLLEYPYIDTTKTMNGIQFSDFGDGRIGVKGTATTTAFFYLKNQFKYDVSLSKSYPYKKLPNDTVISTIGLVEGCTIVRPLDNERLYIRVGSGTTIDTVVTVQLELGSTATAYSPYHLNTYPIPESVRSLTGYGWSAGNAHNSIERTDTGWQYVQRVGSVDLGTLKWDNHTTGNLSFFTDSINNIVTGKTYNAIICSKYATSSIPGRHYLNEYEICQNTSDGVTAKQICVLDNSYQSASEFKTSMSGVMLYYELAEPIITDITDLMADFQENFAVEAGGTLTFENTAKLTVPNSVEYVISLAEVGSV